MAAFGRPAIVLEFVSVKCVYRSCLVRLRVISWIESPSQQAIY
jgi:hypothetical protein